MPTKVDNSFYVSPFQKNYFQESYIFTKKNDILQEPTDSFTDLSPLLRSK